jgi:formamidopyrimidine-DNA glycosylase
MPELPEVESIVVGLRHCLVGRQLLDVEIRWPGAIATTGPDAFRQALRGRTVTAVERRGKFLAFSLPPYALVVHLRMTGRLQARDVPEPALEQDPHMHLRFTFDHGLLYYGDVRKFGRLYLVEDAAEVTGGLGPEPLSPAFTNALWAAQLAAHRRQIKPLLLDQHFVAGLGNIYVDESLWLAGLHPARRSHTLRADEAQRLYDAMRSVLTRAVQFKGATLRDYRGVRNEPGEFRAHLMVYGRAGEPCRRCGQSIVRIVLGSRGTHLCPACQRIEEPGDAQEPGA